MAYDRTGPLRVHATGLGSDHSLADELESIRLPYRELAAGQLLFAEGDLCDTIYILQRGWAVASTMHLSGRRQILRFLLAGSLIGFETSADGTMPCDVAALTDLLLCPLPRQRLLRFCATAPSAGFNLALRLSTEVILDWHLLGSLGTCRADQRVARLLLMLHQRQSQAGGPAGDVILPISQTLIAEATGLTPVHVCRVLKEMRTAALLTFAKGHLKIRDWDRLVELCGLRTLTT